jgi:hypothetical protein
MRPIQQNLFPETSRLLDLRGRSNVVSDNCDLQIFLQDTEAGTSNSLICCHHEVELAQLGDEFDIYAPEENGKLPPCEALFGLGKDRLQNQQKAVRIVLNSIILSKRPMVLALKILCLLYKRPMVLALKMLCLLYKGPMVLVLHKRSMVFVVKEAHGASFQILSKRSMVFVVREAYGASFENLPKKPIALVLF